MKSSTKSKKILSAIKAIFEKKNYGNVRFAHEPKINLSFSEAKVIKLFKIMEINLYTSL